MYIDQFFSSIYFYVNILLWLLVPFIKIFKNKIIRVFLIFLAIATLVIVGGFRYQIGNDWDAYYINFNAVNNGEYNFSYFEPGYAFLNYIFATYLNFNMLLIFITVLYIFTIYKISKNIYVFVIALSLIFPTYFWGDLATLRQTLMLCLFYLLTELNTKLKIFIGIILGFIHYSGVMLSVFNFRNGLNKLYIVITIITFYFIMINYFPDLMEVRVDSLSNRHIMNNFNSVLRNIIVTLMMIFLCSKINYLRNSYHFSLLIWVLLLEIGFLFFDDSLARRIGSLARLSESFILATYIYHYVFLRKNYRLFFLFPLFILFTYRQYSALMYEPELFFPYKNILFGFL